MSTQYQVASVEQLADDGSRVIVELDGVEVAVFNVDGEYHALLNFCVHAGGPLCEGELTGDVTVNPESLEWEYDETEHIVGCPWHGWLFDVETGVCVDDPQYQIPAYEVVVENDTVYVIR